MKKSKDHVNARVSARLWRVVAVGGLVGLVGCARGPDLPDIAEGTPYVRISNGGSIFGGSSAQIYRGDVVIYRSNDGTPEGQRAGFAVLRIGGFERLRGAALEIIDGVDAPEGAEIACLDYGSDVIEVWSAVEAVSVGASCPGSDVVPAQAELRRLLEAELVE